MLTFTTLKKIKHHVPLDKRRTQVWSHLWLRFGHVAGYHHAHDLICALQYSVHSEIPYISFHLQEFLKISVGCTFRGRFIWPTGTTTQNTARNCLLPITASKLAVQHLSKLLHSDIVNTLTGPEVHYLVQSRNVRPPCEVWWKVHNSSQDHKQWVAGCWNLIVVWRLLKYI